jgi:hypothetical protein
LRGRHCGGWASRRKMIDQMVVVDS